jgi:chromosome condensin MukBEF complex kleisin-like MukF subunit
MNINEKNTVGEIQVTQATMKEHQRTMQNDIDELKRLSRDTNAQINLLNQKFDELSGARRTLIWLTGIAISIAAVVTAWVNGHVK